MIRLMRNSILLSEEREIKGLQLGGRSRSMNGVSVFISSILMFL